MHVFATRRLIVRQLDEDDLPAFYALCSDPQIVRYMDRGQPLSEELTHKWIQVSQANYRKHGYGCFAIISRQDHSMIGFGGLVYPPGSAQVEIIYGFSPFCWGQGLATEFVEATIKAGFERWHLPRIEASIHPENKASMRVVQKAGMTYSCTEPDEDGLSVIFYGVDNPSPVSH